MPKPVGGPERHHLAPDGSPPAGPHAGGTVDPGKPGEHIAGLVIGEREPVQWPGECRRRPGGAPCHRRGRHRPRPGRSLEIKAATVNMESLYAGTATSAGTSQHRLLEPGRYSVPPTTRGPGRGRRAGPHRPRGRGAGGAHTRRAADAQGISTKGGGGGTRCGRSSALWLGPSCSGPLGKALPAVLGRRRVAYARGGADDHGQGN